MLNLVPGFIVLLCWGYLLTSTSPVVARVMVAAVIMTRGRGHVANWFIQLEAVSLLVVYVVFIERAGAGLAPFTVIIIFTALASEGAIGLAVIVKNRRGSRSEILKSRF